MQPHGNGLKFWVQHGMEVKGRAEFSVGHEEVFVTAVAHIGIPLTVQG